ncbi:MAG: HAD-IIA family hydrolase, partial [Bacilli bacterium]
MIDFNKIKYFLLDMDGTIFLEDTLIEGTIDFFKLIKEKNIKPIFITNNSSKSPKAYQDKLAKLGLRFKENDFFTSGEATIYYLKEYIKGNNIYLLGTQSLIEQFNNNGYLSDASRKYDALVLGFDTTLTYDKLWQACDLIKEGIPYIATHPDLVCPLKNQKSMPDVGSFIELIKVATNGKTPLVIGKPHHYMLDYLLKKYQINKDEVVIVGDRLYTDILIACENDVSSILVLSG